MKTGDFLYTLEAQSVINWLGFFLTNFSRAAQAHLSIPKETNE